MNFCSTQQGLFVNVFLVVYRRRPIKAQNKIHLNPKSIVNYRAHVLSAGSLDLFFFLPGWREYFAENRDARHLRFKKRSLGSFSLKTTFLKYQQFSNISKAYVHKPCFKFVYGVVFSFKVFFRLLVLG